MPCSTERCIELVNCKLSQPKSLHWFSPAFGESQSSTRVQKEPKSLPKRIVERSNESFPQLCILWMGWKQPGCNVSSFCPEGCISLVSVVSPPGNNWDQCPFWSLFLSKNNLLNDVINIVVELWICPCAVCLHQCLCFFQWATLCCLKDKCAPPSPPSWVCLLAAGSSNTPVSKLFSNDAPKMFRTRVTPAATKRKQD